MIGPSYHGCKPASSQASAVARAGSRKAGTRCEALLRGELWKLGARYRVNVTALPGCPDIVFPRVRVAVFCDGDFWHGRDWESRRLKLERGTNANYWVAKIQRNRLRDWEQTRQLLDSGWTVVRLWESEIQTDCPGLAKAIWQLVRGLADSGASRFDTQVVLA